MAKARRNADDELTELVRTLLIATLRLAGVPRDDTRAVARCDTNRVANVIKHIKVRDKSQLKGD